MFLTIHSEDERPIYRQIADGIKALIAGGRLREGTPLPSVRQVAGDLGVNLNTVAIAYRQLQEEGLVTIRHGAGTVVAAGRDRSAGEDQLRRALRTSLAQLLLAGWNDSRIAAAVRQELDSLRTKGEAK